jgi:NAD(P)-dependent dehydrogenase (short-subunit alcohol dehydrogenase family)
MYEKKVIVITGGASGIGAAIGERFGRDGARVAILDFDPGALKSISDRFSGMGIDVLGVKCDVTSERQCESAMKKVIKHFGGIDILVNNAGITQRSTFRNTDLSVYRKVLDVNFFGSLNSTKPALESLIRRKGTIVVTTSLAGFAPLYGRTGYSASKHALHGFFHSLRTELAHLGVHVLMLCPNFTATNLQARALNGTGKKNIGERNIVGKEATPESVARAVYYGVLKKKRELILTPMGKLVYILTRIFPSFYERTMTGKIKPEFDRSEAS